MASWFAFNEEHELKLKDLCKTTSPCNTQTWGFIFNSMKRSQGTRTTKGSQRAVGTKKKRKIKAGPEMINHQTPGHNQTQNTDSLEPRYQFRINVLANNKDNNKPANT